MINSQVLAAAREKARKSKRKVLNLLPGGRQFCDCTECYGKQLPRSSRLIDKHRRDFGRHPTSLHPGAPCAGSAQSTAFGFRSKSSAPDTATEDSNPLMLAIDFGASASVSEPLAFNLTSALDDEHPLIPHSGSGFGSPSHSNSQPGSPALGLYLAEQAPGSNMDLDNSLAQLSDEDSIEEPTLGPTTPAADVELFGRLLHIDRAVDIPPPLRLRGGQESDDERSDGDDQDRDSQDDEPNPDPLEEVEDDPPEMHVEPIELGGEPDVPGEENNGIPAHDEHPTIFNIYLRTWVLYAFRGVTHDVVQAVLESHKATLLAEARRGDFPAEYIAQIRNMATTLRALERRIGMDFSDLITIYSLCPLPQCGKRYTLEELSELPDPQCVRQVGNDRCEGMLYTESTLTNGTQKRTPTKSFPYNSLPQALGRLLSRPGITGFMQHWRRADDEPVNEDVPPPLAPEDWMNNVDQNQRFGDMSEAWGWRCQGTGLERTWDGQEYEDVPIGETPLALSRLPLGLNLGLNMDGFQAFRGKFAATGTYSVNGVYIVVNNLPFHLRMLIENMILAMVIPGPYEPKGYAFDQVLEPLVDDLIDLSRGINLPVYNPQTRRIEEQTVYASLSSLLVDWIARIKCTGHAGVASEHNHCLYCKMRQCDLSLPRGYLSEGFELRDPHEHLQDKCRWRDAPEEEREPIRQETGTTFVDFDRIPGFYSFDNCPIDAMHLFDLGITPAIVKDILYSPGMLRKRHARQPADETPEARFNAFVRRTYFPPHCSRLPCELSKMGSRTKAEQWRNLRTILVPALFEAWRIGDTIPDANIPRGGENTTNFKVQQSLAAHLLRRRRHAHNADGGDVDNMPQIQDCASSRNPRDYIACIMRYCVATHGLFQHQITRQDVADMTALLELVGVGFTRMNVHLSPSFHNATHIGGHILRYGNVSGTSLNRFEQANRVLIKINTNGHGRGVLEATMAKGWMRRAESHRYVKLLQSIEEPTEDDLTTLDALLDATKNGPEHDFQRGVLDAVLAGEAPIHGLEPVRLATQPARVDFRSVKHARFYELMVGFCNDHNPFDNAIFYGYGREPEGGVHLSPRDSTLSYPNFFRYGVRYGSAGHSRGYRARYGYIDNRVPVIIQGIYESTVRVQDQEHKFLAVMVQRFVVPNPQPLFLWNYWGDFMGIHAWEFEHFGPLEAVHPDAFSGVFALSDIEMTYGHYWITYEMANTSPTNRNNPR
ncbi:Transposase family Tnp2 protein [Ceratobasidium sp. AG-Ba]|nr:Transposase family Tnp2 protein [Ceratobasidium sp. AG-Ba]